MGNRYFETTKVYDARPDEIIPCIHIVRRMSSNDSPIRKRHRANRCNYNACDLGSYGNGEKNKKISGFICLFKKTFDTYSEATEWAEITLRKMLQRYMQLGVRGILTDEEMKPHAKRVKKIVMKDLHAMDTPQAICAAKTLHKIRAGTTVERMHTVHDHISSTDTTTLANFVHRQIWYTRNASRE